MEVDEDPKFISTAVVTKCFDVRPQLPGALRDKSCAPYKELFGEGDAFFHDDLARIKDLVAKLVLQKSDLDDDDKKAIRTRGFRFEQWCFAMQTVVANQDDDLPLESIECDRLKYVMNRLAHSPAQEIFRGVTTSIAPGQAAFAWRAAHVTLGSWHAKTRQVRVVTPLAPRRQLQSTLQFPSTSTHSGSSDASERKRHFASKCPTSRRAMVTE